MKKKQLLSMMLAGSMLMGVLAACAPAGQQAVTPPTAAPAQTQPAAPGAPVEPPPVEAGFQRGMTVVSAAETPSVTPARHTALVGHFINILTHNGLFRVQEEGLAPVPDLVEEWTALSDTLFEMRLREGVMFHNGDIMTAHDVAASLEYVRRYPEQRGNQLAVYSWEVVDDHTIIIDTGEPNVVLFNELAHQANFMFPLSLIEAGHDFTVDPVGTGPFVFNEWRAGDFLHFEAFENYFDRDRFPRLGYIHWRIIPEGASRTIALETGEVDYVIDVALPDVPRLQADPRITVMERPGATYQHFMMNIEMFPFDNIYVRRAVDMALDREAMVLASLDGFGIPVWAAVPPTFAGTTDEGARSFDPEGARALLAEQGLDPSALGFEMLVFDEQQRRRAEVAQSNLMDIGIPTTITMMEFATWLSFTLEDNSFQASFGNQTTTNLPVFLRSMLHSSFIGTGNRQRTNLPELDELINRAFMTIDETARLAILEEASRIANADASLVGTNMNILFRAFNADLVVPELAANGFMFKNMIHWNE